MNDSQHEVTDPEALSRTGRRTAHLVHSVEGAVEHAVESAERAVEHAVESAERSLAQRLGARGLRLLLAGLRVLGWAALAFYAVFCVSLIVLRVWLMPHIDEWRGSIEAAASSILKRQVSIGRIESSWQGFNPRLQLTDVQLHDADGAVSLTLPHIDAVVSWTSVPILQPHLRSLEVVAPELQVRRVSESRLEIAGIPVELQAGHSGSPAMDWLLQQRRVAVTNATVHYTDLAAPEAQGRDAASAPQTTLNDVNIVLTHHFGTHHFALRARPPADVADVVDIRGWFDRRWAVPPSDPSGWSGRLYAQLGYVDLARLESIARVLPQPARLIRGNGAVRAWIDFDALNLRRARADVALTDVELQLRSGEPPVRLSSLQGRVTQQAWQTGAIQGQDVTLSHLTVAEPGGTALPPTDITYRISRAANSSAPDHTEVGVDRVSLEDLDRLASRLPLPPQAQDLITLYSLRGSLTDAHASWDGDPDQVSNLAFRSRFDNLSAAAQPADPPLDADGRPRAGQPGFQNLTGSIDVSPSEGTLVLASSEARVFLPGLLDDPEVPTKRLNAHVHWKANSASRAGWSIDIDDLALSNDDLEIGVAGSLQMPDQGPPVANLTANVVRANAAAVPRYMPVVMGPNTRSWLHSALRDGRVVSGNLRLRGNMDQFPFVKSDSGEFHLALHVTDATLDYGPSTPARPRAHPWPILNGVEADLNFDANQIGIEASRASVYGFRLSKVSGLISGWDTHDPHLTLGGQGNGQLSDMVGFVNASPVGEMIGGFLDSARATGPGRVQIKLDLPLNHIVDSHVEGAIFFQGNDVTLRSDLAPLLAVAGRLDFTERGVNAAGINAGFLGGPARLDAETGADGAVAVRVAGMASPSGMRRQFDSPAMRRVLDSARGSLHYSAALNMHGRSTDVHVASDLTGLALDLPEPFHKAAGEALPVRADLVSTPDAQPRRDTVSLSAGSLLNVRIERAAGADGSMQIERGLVRVGNLDGTSATLPDTGLLVHLTLPRLDADRWSALLDGGSDDSAMATSGAPSGARSLPDTIAAHIDELWVSGKVLHNVVLGASRSADGGWDANIVADQTSGSLHWVSGSRSAPGKLTARLAKLIIPQTADEPVAQVLDAPARELPELDIIADDFEIGATRLGRLEMNAQMAGAGRGAAWQLKRLHIDNPDGHMSGSGQWQREPGSQRRRMTMTMTMDIANAGNLLGRFGLNSVFKSGSGKLSGTVSWLGSPFSIDYASLSGDLQMSADKGQFLKADPGAARLLSVISLQALPRRAQLDFRDVFSQGFSFDTIRANAHVDKGVLSTHDFKMVGTSATVLIDGDADLKSETQHLHVLVLPQMDASSTAVVLSFVANPLIGVGTFLAQWALRHPLSKLFSVEYDITGSWADPQVKKRETKRPETSEEGAG